jgi:glycosyltransferase involved in cell wall biosynthesis
MKVSIITPSFNSEKYIEDNLRSVHLQQEGDFTIEQIIVDGNSTDRTLAIIRDFKEKYNANIKIIQGKDKNMYDAINKGLKEMNGDIWACLNTDDFYNSGIINNVVKEFINESELDVVYGYIDIIDETGKFLYTRYLPKFNLNDLILCGHCYIIKQPSSFLHKRVVDRIGLFDVDYDYASDYDYFIRVGSYCNLKLIEKTLTQFRKHKSSISYNDDSQTIQWKESAGISKKYKLKFGVSKKFLHIPSLKFYLAQIKIKNSKYIVSNYLNIIRHISVKLK